MTSFNIRRVLSGVLCVGVLFGMSGIATTTPAQAKYPDKVVQLLVPFGAGGGTDRWARVMSSVGFDVFEHGLRVQNRGGAQGTIGWKHMLDKGADGHTVIMASPTPVIAAMLEKTPPYDPANVKIVAYYSVIRPTLMVPKNKPYSDWNGFVAHLKKGGKKPSVGGTLLLLLGLVNTLDQLGLADNVTKVTYSGTGNTMNDFLGGHIDLAMVTESTAVQTMDRAIPIFNGSGREYVGAAAKVIGKVPNPVALGLEPYNPPRFLAMHPDTPDAQVDAMSEKFGKLLGMKPVKNLIGKLGEEIAHLPRDKAEAEYKKMLVSSRKYLKLFK
jgi:tripartite-type tricarboxylate transporter receptor subunit TctC